MTTELPSEHTALVLKSIEAGFEIKRVSTPRATHGSAVVRVLAAGIISYSKELYSGQRPYPFPTPLVPGSSCIGRIAAVGPDAASLTVDQLVFVDCVIRGRDNPSDIFLSAIHEGGSDGSRKLMQEARQFKGQYINAPLENCIPLNEETLCNHLGYSFAQLMYMSNILVPYGGLRDIGVEPGDTVLVCPATGGFGGAGVLVARSMGARVIAMGRNKQELLRLQEVTNEVMPGGRVETVESTGNQEADTKAIQAFGPVDKILDLTPVFATDSMQLMSALMALRYEGQASLMGFANTDAPAVKWNIVAKNLVLKGKLMYTRDDMIQLVKILERGLLPKGSELAQPKVFHLAQWEEAFSTAPDWTGLGRCVVIAP